MSGKRVNRGGGRRNRRRRQIRMMKFALYFLVVALPCVWLVRQKHEDSEPMRVAKAFADDMIHARFLEARMLATGRSAEDIAFYAEWVGCQSGELNGCDARFEVTHAQVLMPTDTVNVICGKVFVPDAEGVEREVQRLRLTVVREDDRWLVDYHAGFY